MLIAAFLRHVVLDPLLVKRDSPAMKQRKFVVGTWLMVGWLNLFYAILASIAAWPSQGETSSTFVLIMTCFINAVVFNTLYLILRVRKKCETWFVMVVFLYVMIAGINQVVYFENRAIHWGIAQTAMATGLVLCRPELPWLLPGLALSVLTCVLTSVQEVYDYGLYYLDFDGGFQTMPKWLVLVAYSMMWIFMMNAVIAVFLVDALLKKAEHKNDLACRVSKATALALSVYDTDSVKEMLEVYASNGDDCDHELRAAFQDIATNLEEYRGYLPNWLLLDEEEIEETDYDDVPVSEGPCNRNPLEKKSPSQDGPLRQGGARGGMNSGQRPEPIGGSEGTASPTNTDLEAPLTQNNLQRNQRSNRVHDAIIDIFSPSHESTQWATKTPNGTADAAVLRTQLTRHGSGVTTATKANEQEDDLNVQSEDDLGGSAASVSSSVGSTKIFQVGLDRSMKVHGCAYTGKVTVALIDFRTNLHVASPPRGSGREEVTNSFVDLLGDVAATTFGAIHSVVGDTAKVSWNATQRVSQPELKALRCIEKLREKDQYFRDLGVAICGAVATGTAQCHAAGSSKRFHIVAITAEASGWMDAHHELHQIARRYRTVLCDLATREVAKYTMELAAVDVVEFSDSPFAPTNLGSPAPSNSTSAVLSGVPSGVVVPVSPHEDSPQQVASGSYPPAPLVAGTIYEHVRDPPGTKKKAGGEELEWMYQLESAEHNSVAAAINRVFEESIDNSASMVMIERRARGGVNTPPSIQASSSFPTVTVADFIQAEKDLRAIEAKEGNVAFFDTNPMCKRLLKKVIRLATQVGKGGQQHKSPALNGSLSPQSDLPSSPKQPFVTPWNIVLTASD